MREFIGDGETRRQLEAQGFMPQAGTPGDLALRIRSERSEWAAVVKRLGVTVE